MKTLLQDLEMVKVANMVAIDKLFNIVKILCFAHIQFQRIFLLENFQVTRAVQAVSTIRTNLFVEFY